MGLVLFLDPHKRVMLFQKFEIMKASMQNNPIGNLEHLPKVSESKTWLGHPDPRGMSKRKDFWQTV